MAKQGQSDYRTSGVGTVEGGGVNEIDGMPTPQPSLSATVAVGAIGPGALAAIEALPGVPGGQNESAKDRVDDGAGLNLDEIESLHDIIQRLGSVEALIRWLQAQPDLK
jgi:hypothetical protein